MHIPRSAISYFKLRFDCSSAPPTPLDSESSLHMWPCDSVAVGIVTPLPSLPSKYISLSLMHVLSLLFLLPAISSASADDQIVMSAGLGKPDYTPLITPQPTLADLLTIEPSASIFYSYARELELSAIFSEPSANVSLFVPTNKAIMALSRKPWVLVDVIASCWWINGYALWMQTSRARRNWRHWNHGGAMRYICD